jgi:hypothetical protein
MYTKGADYYYELKSSKFDRHDSVKWNRTQQIMLIAFKLSLLLMIVGVSLYLFFAVLGVSNVQYRRVIAPSLSEHTHPLKTALQVNTTQDTYDVLDAFHNIHYDPYDLYI